MVVMVEVVWGVTHAKGTRHTPEKEHSPIMKERREDFRHMMLFPNK